MLLLPLTAPWEMAYGGVQRARSLMRAYDRDGWSGAFWKTVASMPVLGSISAAVDAYREAYALPMTDPRDRARAAGQITLPIAEAVVGVGVAAYGLAEGVGAAKGARVGAVLDESAKGTGNFGSTHKLTPDEALTAGERWIGPGYKEVGGSGTGVFRSANGIRQFRIDEGSITGAHGEVGPHVHFETLDPVRRGKEAILSNNHVPLE